jgi:hypothetical protein
LAKRKEKRNEMTTDKKIKVNDPTKRNELKNRTYLSCGRNLLVARYDLHSTVRFIVSK